MFSDDKNRLFDVEHFVSDQLTLWADAASNYCALRAVERRIFDMGTYHVVVQYNPARRRSTGANLSKESVAARPCFLCATNRPIEQITHLFIAQSGEQYSILLNPYPIFNYHLTIVSNAHTPQTILGRVSDMAEIAQTMPNMVLFFNGANCGASAPDHMHFQASPIGAWPLISDFEKNEQLVLKHDDVIISVATQLDRLVYKVCSHTSSFVEIGLKNILEHHHIVDNMVNVIMHVNNADGIVAYIIPRKAFRPWQYSAPEPQCLMISPASVEVGGMIITPVKDHFDKITVNDIQSIYNQVCFSLIDCLKF